MPTSRHLHLLIFGSIWYLRVNETPFPEYSILTMLSVPLFPVTPSQHLLVVQFESLLAGEILVEADTLCCMLKYCKCCMDQSPPVVSFTQRHKPRFPAVLLTRHLLGEMRGRMSTPRRLRRPRSKTKLREGLRILVNMCGL